MHCKGFFEKNFPTNGILVQQSLTYNYEDGYKAHSDAVGLQVYGSAMKILSDNRLAVFGKES